MAALAALELEVHLQTLRLLEMLVFVFEKKKWKWSPKNVNLVLEFLEVANIPPSLKHKLVYYVEGWILKFCFP